MSPLDCNKIYRTESLCICFPWRWNLSWHLIIMPNFKTCKSLYLCREGFEFCLCGNWQVCSRYLELWKNKINYLINTPVENWLETPTLVFIGKERHVYLYWLNFNFQLWRFKLTWNFFLCVLPPQSILIVLPRIVTIMNGEYRHLVKT